MSHWDKIGKKPHHGICVPLFSLGKFTDLIPLIHWCTEVGFDCIQLLPLNDTGFDPSPYNVKDSVKLHPRYGDPKEMAAAKVEATKCGVFLIGDLPFCMGRDSVDVENYPEYFDLSKRAGAPPDKYNPKGQDWGFPIYRWENCEAWLRTRLNALEPFYHAYRIDHAVGLFRIWTNEGFIPPDHWQIHGEKLLRWFLKFSPLLPIAENLGTIPDMVYSTLEKFEIPGMTILRYNDPTTELDLSTLGTHDMPSLGYWWTHFPHEAIKLATRLHLPYHPVLSTQNRIAILRHAHSTKSFFRINLLQEYLNCFPELSWNDDSKDQINKPGPPGKWDYRFKPSLKEILNHAPLKSLLKDFARK